MKQRVLQLLTGDPAARLLRPLQQGTVSIFMFHRFADSEAGTYGACPDAIRANLAFLRRHRFNILSLPHLLDGLREGRMPETPAVVLTIDDGYDDFARVAAPIFAEFDCPSTVFVVSGFVDERLWMWWDRVYYAFGQTKRTALRVPLGDRMLDYTLGPAMPAGRAAAHYIDRLKVLPNDVMEASIAAALRALEVELPPCATAEYAPMSWDTIRRLGSQGVTFGPHTVTHPILSNVDEGRAVFEVQESWRRLSAETSAATPIFCFPNGDSASFGAREVRAAVAAGMRGAVTTDQDYVLAGTVRSSEPLSAFAIPRFPWHDDTAQFRQIVTGVERGKRFVRRAITATG
jgi:peptidoglycan/xylan/chitin deacetylase (PgdA/CDA1 family)